MVGIDDVARAAGVSTATVSRTLSGRGPVSAGARARVLDAADRLGYVVSAAASSLASGRTRNIGVLGSLPDRWFFATVIGAISARLLPHGFDLTLYHLTDDPDQRRTVFERSLRRGRVDGLVVLSARLSDAELDELEALELPVVSVGPNPRLRALAVDDEAVGVAATTHLLNLGHTRIAHVGLETDDPLHIPTRRLRGWERALADAGIPASARPFAAADFTFEGGRRAARALLAAPERPTAVFAASDEMAVGVIAAAREAGLDVPRDLSVVGVDGHELSAFFEITTIDQFPQSQGERAADAMLAALGLPVAAPAAALPFELVVRASTAPPRP